jgi:chitinase
MYCNNNKYQAACCTVSTDISAMKLYGQCSWADWPMCDNGKCTNSETVSSTTGSGGASCNTRSFNAMERKLIVQERKYCCDATNENSKWDDCQWYNGLGWGPAGHSWSKDNYCRSGCPSDRVRVGMDKYGGGCLGKGARSNCCLPKLQTVTITKRSDWIDIQYTDALESFLEQPICYDSSGSGGLQRREEQNASSINTRE